MTRRDLAWRVAGAAMFAAAGAIGLATRSGQSGAIGLLTFLMAMLGVLLVVQGKRVALVLRIERGRHRALAQAIHGRRRRPAARDQNTAWSPRSARISPRNSRA